MEYLKSRNINDINASAASYRNPNVFDRDLYTFNEDIKKEIELHGFSITFEEADKDLDWPRRWGIIKYRRPESCINFGNIDYLNSCPNDEIEAETTKEYVFLVKSIAQELITSDMLERYEDNKHIIVDMLAESAGLIIDPINFNPVVMFYAKLKRINPDD